MAKIKLSNLSDAEYKALTPQQLMSYNVDLPEPDYQNPYLPDAHPFPRVMFRLSKDDAGVEVLEECTVKNDKELKKLGAEWVKNPLELGIETAPAAPEISVRQNFIKIPEKGATVVPDAPARG